MARPQWRPSPMPPDGAGAGAVAVGRFDATLGERGPYPAVDVKAHETAAGSNE
jgi:hypothetical protein